MTDTAQREVIAGPSREELFDALRLRHEGRKVTFTVTPDPQPPNKRFTIESVTFPVQVTMIEAMDGSGNNWFLNLHDKFATLGSLRLEGRINTNTRKGWVKVVRS